HLQAQVQGGMTFVCEAWASPVSLPTSRLARDPRHTPRNAPSRQCSPEFRRFVCTGLIGAPPENLVQFGHPLTLLAFAPIYAGLRSLRQSHPSFPKLQTVNALARSSATRLARQATPQESLHTLILGHGPDAERQSSPAGAAGETW